MTALVGFVFTWPECHPPNGVGRAVWFSRDPSAFVGCGAWRRFYRLCDRSWIGPIAEHLSNPSHHPDDRSECLDSLDGMEALAYNTRQGERHGSTVYVSTGRSVSMGESENLGRCNISNGLCARPFACVPSRHIGIDFFKREPWRVFVLDLRWQPVENPSGRSCKMADVHADHGRRAGRFFSLGFPVT